MLAFTVLLYCSVKSNMPGTTESKHYLYPHLYYKSVRVVVLLLLCLTWFHHSAQSQCGTGTSPIYNIDFSAKKDTAWSVASSRSGTACVGTGGADNTCIRFNVQLNSGSDLLNFSSSQLTGASFYSINCGPLIPIGTPACITGLSSVCISFCKPGNNSVTYTVTASSIIKGSEDLILRQNCSGTMSVSGVSAASVQWRSVFPGASGAYNSYLSSTSGATSVTVTPITGAPSYIDYEVSGTGACTGVRRDTIRVYTVSPMTVAVAPANPAICSGASVALTSTVTGGNPPYIYSWSSGQSTTGITVNTIGTYTLSVSDNTANCPAAQQSVTVTAAATPAAPTVAGVSICSGNTATLTPSAPGGTYEWYTAASGGTLLFTGNSFTTPVLTTTTTYYVQTRLNGCPSARTAVTVTVNPVPAAPTAAGTTICSGNTALLNATAPGGSYSWYSQASGGTALTNTAAYTTPVLNSNTTYYVQTLVAGCTSARTAVSVTVTPLPATPTASGTTICAGNTATVNATAPGGTYSWYDAASGGVLLQTGVAYTSPTLSATTTYYVQTLVNGCVSAARAAVTITVNPIPAAPTVSNTGVCAGLSATLNATAPGGTYRWYDAAAGGNLLNTGSQYTTPGLENTTNYYVAVTSAAGCTGARTTATVTVTPRENPAFVYPSGTVCKTGGHVVPTINGGIAGVFTESTGSLIFVNTGSGEIDPSANAVGVYNITFTTTGSCVYSSTSSIAITNNPDASFVYAAPYCQGQTNPLPSFPIGSSAGQFSSADPNLQFKNRSTGEIDLQTSLPGTYTVENRINIAGCALAVASNTIQINPIATANAGVDQVVCMNGSINLSGIAGGSANTGTWSGGSGLFTNAGLPNASYTPASNESMVLLTFTTNDPDGAGPCTAVSDQLLVDVKPLPAAPTVNIPPVCSGGNVSFTALSPGGTYRWYANASGGPVLQTGSTFSLSNLSSTNPYYVSTTSADGCEGPRATVVPVINPLPAITSVNAATICTGIAQSYNILASIPGSAFTWSRAAVTGISNPVTAGNTSAVINEALVNLMSTPIDVDYQIVPVANGCSGSPFTYRVQVWPSPPTPTASTGGAVCEGEPIQLNTPVVNGGVYQWTGPAGFSSTQPSPVLSNATAAMAGTYQVTLAINGCVSAPGSVVQTVKTVPAAPVLTNPAAVCAGDDLKLTAPIILGASYQWSGPAGFSAATQSPVISNTSLAMAGNYTLRVTVDGCVSPAGSAAAVINPIPAALTITPGAIPCIGQAFTMSADDVVAGVYHWTGPNGFTANTRQVTIPAMTNANNGIYQVAVTVAGCPGVATSYEALVKPTPAAPSLGSNSPVCENQALTLSASAGAGAVFNWTGPNGFISTDAAPRINAASLAMGGTYFATATVDGCVSTATPLAVTVNPIPAAPSVNNSSPICEGGNLQLRTTFIAGASYSWTGPAGFNATQQNPVITNAGTSLAGTYNLQITVNGCASPTAATTAIINPIPGPLAVQSSGAACIGQPLQIVADSVVAGVYQWTGPNGFTAATRQLSFSSMTPSLAGTYQVAVSVAGCPGVASSFNAVVKPTPASPVVASNGPVCENKPLQFNTTPVTGGTFKWTGPGNFNSFAASPRIDSARLSMAGNYAVTVTVDGCVSNAATLAVQVLPQPAAPVISSNSPVCVGSPIRFTATGTNGASYVWQGGNGLNSTTQNPVISHASLTDSGRYGAIVNVNGCYSDTSYVQVKIDEPASVFAGNDQTVCANNALIKLTGVIGGGTKTGIWTSNGTGTFLAGNTALSGTYMPSIQDTARGLVRLTLTSTNNGSCQAIASTLLINITAAPVLDLGNDKIVCVNDSIIPLQVSVRHAGGVLWNTSGTGLFDPGNLMLKGVYKPSDADKRRGRVAFQVTSTGNGNCLAVTDQLLVNMAPAPTVNAGADRYVFEDNNYTLSPTISGNIQSYQWSPSTYLSNPQIANPIFRAKEDQLLVLQVTSNNGCTATDSIFLTVLKPFPIPNVFSPNGDGIHDTWVIPELAKYPDAEVSVFDRYGRRVFYTVKYTQPWDGRFEGKPLPFATYYYVIDPKIIPAIRTGSVTIIR